MDIGLKSFISEDQIEQKKRIKQEQWEQTRRPDQPLECPEEEYDPRTLYERLKEQRDKKQEDFEESRKLKNCIKVLDNDEVEFLSKVDEHKLKEMMDKQNEEKQAIEEFKKQVADQTQAEQEKKIGEFKRSLFSKQPPSSSKQSAGKDASNQLARTTRRQAKLLQNAVKRKASEDDNEEHSAKRQKDGDGGREDGGSNSGKGEKSKDDDKNDGDKNDDKNESGGSAESDPKKAVVLEQPTAFKVLGVLPGLASYYSDSSNSAYDSDESSEQVNSSELAPFFLSKQTREIVRMNKTVKKFSH